MNSRGPVLKRRKTVFDVSGSSRSCLMSIGKETLPFLVPVHGRSPLHIIRCQVRGRSSHCTYVGSCILPSAILPGVLMDNSLCGIWKGQTPFMVILRCQPETRSPEQDLPSLGILV